MLFYLFALLMGYYELSSEEPTKTANVLRSGRENVFGMQVRQGRLYFHCLFFTKRRLLRFLDEKGVSYRIHALRGFPGILYRYRLRVGAFLGLFVAIALTFLSQRFLWQIRVVGNEQMTDEEVLSLLAAEGVYEGAYIASLDLHAIANRCAMKSESVAWMSVNVIGNKAEAVVVEYVEKADENQDEVPSNVVALKDGVVKRVEVTSGVSTVGEGAVVKKGQLLISGVNLLRNESYIYQKASGHVYAETLNEITVEKSLIYTEKVYSGEILTEKSYIFFNKAKKFTQDSGNLPASCDRIETKERVMLFGVIPLPIWTVRVTYHAFTLEERRLAEEEAKRLAEEEAFKRLSEGELVSFEEEYSFDGEKVTVTLCYRIVEDIAYGLPLFETPS